MSEPSAPSSPFVNHPPPVRTRIRKRAKPESSTIFFTSLVILYLAISFSLIIPIAAASESQSTPSDSSEQNNQSALARDQLIELTRAVKNRLSERSMGESAPRSIRESSGAGIEEDGSGDDEIVLTSEEIKAIDLELFKKQLLRKMGLTGRPPANNQRTVLPVYLWDIYDNVADGATVSPTFDSLVPENEAEPRDDTNDGFSSSIARRTYYDTVRTFFATGNPLWPTTLLFDIHRLPSNERWVEAELRVPWHNLLSNKLNAAPEVNETSAWPITEREPSQDPSSSAREERKHFIRINLYEVGNETVDIRHLIDTKLINAASARVHSRAWTTFDVLSIVSRASMKLNVVKLAVEFVDFSPDGQLSSSKFLSAGQDESMDVEHSAAVVMYGFDDDGKEKPIKYKNFYKDDIEPGLESGLNARRKRQTHNKQQRASNRPRLRGADSNNRRSPLSARRPPQQHLCQRRPLIIRFEDLNWQDWILAPQEYAAYYCGGQCVYPFADGQNATNHAIVQALVNSVSPRTAPRPCCVATETSSISMLYTDIDKNIVIKNYPDMIVEGCGCR